MIVYLQRNKGGKEILPDMRLTISLLLILLSLRYSLEIMKHNSISTNVFGKCNDDVYFLLMTQ